jgi:hypothetical protein
MYSYSAYDLCIHSDIPLPSLPPGGALPDVTIRFGEIDVKEASSRPRGGMFVLARFDYEALGADVVFSVEDGRSIVLYPRKPIETELLQGWVIGVIMSVLLRQRGHHVMHGSAVAKDGFAFGFLGDSGWGKSTLAAFLCQHGYHFLTDDMLVLRREEGQPHPIVMPSHKHVRLYADSGELFVDEFDELPLVSSFTPKRVRPIERDSEDPFPLKRLYVLDNVPADKNAVEPLSKQESMLHLIAHTRSKDLLDAEAFRSAHFEQCAGLLREVPVARLRRVRALEALPDLKQTIEEDLATLAHGPNPFEWAE